MALGYVFWLIISNLTGAETIGRVAAATAFGWIVSTIAMLGIPVGIQRFLGKAVAENDSDSFHRFTEVSFLITVLSISAISICLLILNERISEFFNLSQELLLIGIVMVVGGSMYQLFRAILVARLSTKLVVISDIIGEVSRIIVSVSLIILFYEDLGLLAGFAVLFFIPASILGVYTMRILSKTAKPVTMTFAKTSLSTLRASTVSWIPSVITQVGTQMGFLVAFGLLGAFDTGLYFAAFALYSVLFAIPTSILSIAYPIISGMTAGREIFLRTCIKISMIILMPLAISVMVYASPILSLFGEDFQVAAPPTVMLLASLVPTTIANAVVFLAYSHGKYRNILVIGVLGSSMKVLLYPFLVADYGALGVSLAFLVGSIASFAVSLIYASRMGFQLRWKEIGMITMIPASLGLFLITVGLSAAFGVAVIIAVSWILYLRLGVIKVGELRSIVSTALPSDMATTICNGLDRVDRLLKQKAVS
jgi:O-antigen/teichoic acid export membrane protein